MDVTSENVTRLKLKRLLLLQGIVVLYTVSGVIGKFAAKYAFLSKGFVLLYCMEILFLGVYALLWQQIIKFFDLSVAYANRAIALLWSMLWAVIIFGETITLKNFVGVVIVIAGTMLVNKEPRE